MANSKPESSAKSNSGEYMPGEGFLPTKQQYASYRTLANAAGILSSDLMIETSRKQQNVKKFVSNNLESIPTTLRKRPGGTFYRFKDEHLSSHQVKLLMWAIRCKMYEENATLFTLHWLYAIGSLFPEVYKTCVSSIINYSGPITFIDTEDADYLEIICSNDDAAEDDLAEMFREWEMEYDSTSFSLLPLVILLHYLTKNISPTNYNSWLGNRCRALSSVLLIGNEDRTLACVKALNFNATGSNSINMTCQGIIKIRTTLFESIAGTTGSEDLLGSACNYLMGQYRFAGLNLIFNSFSVLRRTPWIFFMRSMAGFRTEWSNITRFLNNFDPSMIPYLKILKPANELTSINQAGHQTLAAIMLQINSRENHTQQNQKLNDAQIDLSAVNKVIEEYDLIKARADVGTRHDLAAWFGITYEDLTSHTPSGEAAAGDDVDFMDED